jgi:MATE family multidrug resistance protein
LTWQLLTLAAPMVAISTSRMMVNNIDAIMVGTLGTAALGAIVPASMILFAFSCLGMGMASSIQTFVSQADGRGEPQRGGGYLWQGIYIAILLGAVSTPLIVTVPVWFRRIGELCHHPPDVLALEIEFLTWALWSIAPATACVAIESFCNGIKRPMVALWAVLAQLATIIVANYALIYGHFGFPALGMVGCGVATVLSWIVRLTVLLIPLLLSRNITRRFHVWASLWPDWPRLSEIIRVGAPISMQWLLDLGAWIVFLHVMMPQFGPVAMAANSIAVQCMHLSFMPSVGFGQALTTQVGNAIGAGRPELAVRRTFIARRVIVGYMAVMGGVFLVAGRPMALIFGATPEVADAAALALIWCAVFQAFDGLCMTYSFALRGTGDTTGPAWLFLWCCWGIFVAGGLTVSMFLPRQLGVHGPWILCATYIIVLGVLLWRRFHAEGWRTIRLFDRETQIIAVEVDTPELAAIGVGPDGAAGAIAAGRLDFEPAAESRRDSAEAAEMR